MLMSAACKIPYSLGSFALASSSNLNVIFWFFWVYQEKDKPHSSPQTFLECLLELPSLSVFICFRPQLLQLSRLPPLLLSSSQGTELPPVQGKTFPLSAATNATWQPDLEDLHPFSSNDALLVSSVPFSQIRNEHIPSMRINTCVRMLHG